MDSDEIAGQCRICGEKILRSDEYTYYPDTGRIEHKECQKQPAPSVHSPKQ